MAGVLRKFMHGAPASSNERGSDDEEDRNNVEYSTALEYSGPPLAFDVPRAFPIDVTQIPIASTVASGSLSNGLSFPVIQPIWRSNKSTKRVSNNINALSCPNGDCNDCDGIEEVENNQETEGGNFRCYMNPMSCESPMGSEGTSCSVSSELFSCRDEDEIEAIEQSPRGHNRRPSVVNFCDPDSSDVIQEENDTSETESVVFMRPEAVRPGKKGTCYRCMKGSRLTEKECCIVCGAKYCYSCVLRVMGSMPEGRKCITCIGHRINERNRKILGKCSRILKQLLSETMLDSIMSCERTCRVNQLPPELVYVNLQRLSELELITLQTCQNPPKGLKPGHYWYDKMSGFWGEQGHRPCQMISSQMNIGGQMQKDASNGNTNVFINNREITKGELQMLEVAGVKCEGTTSFWVGADGSYQEEGMQNVKGKIWETKRARLICRILSLPTPPESGKSSKEGPNAVTPSNLEPKMLQKLLLVGCEKSGTNTIFKQAKIVYGVPFTEEEHRNIKFMIQTNLYRYLGILLKGREQFEQEILAERIRHVADHGSQSVRSSADNTGQVDDKTIFSLGPRLRAFSDSFLEMMAASNLESEFPFASREYAPLVKDLWKDAAIQATYTRQNELGKLPKVASYFLDRADEIAWTDYEPSETDILYAEGIASSKGISCMEYSFPGSERDNCEPLGYVHYPSLRYQLIRVHQGILGKNCKWLEMFEDIDIVLFCVSLADYNEFSKDSNGVSTNKMIASRNLFESIVTHQKFKAKKFLLILTKFDLLEEKIKHVPLTQCAWFSDFNPVQSHNRDATTTNTSLAVRAFQYVAVKFKRLFQELTENKMLYVWLVNGLVPDNVDEALRYAREILKWQDEEANCTHTDPNSITNSNEASTSA